MTLKAALWRNGDSMPVRVYLFKKIANEMLERTTGGQDSGLEPEDANKWFL